MTEDVAVQAVKVGIDRRIAEHVVSQRLIACPAVFGKWSKIKRPENGLCCRLFTFVQHLHKLIDWSANGRDGATFKVA